MTQGMQARELVDIVNAMWRAFDQLVDQTRGQVLKIETLGPVYLCASGLPDHVAEHAATLVRQSPEPDLPSLLSSRGSPSKVLLHLQPLTF